MFTYQAIDLTKSKEDLFVIDKSKTDTQFWWTVIHVCVCVCVVCVVCVCVRKSIRRIGQLSALSQVRLENDRVSRRAKVSMSWNRHRNCRSIDRLMTLFVVAAVIATQCFLFSLSLFLLFFFSRVIEFWIRFWIIIKTGRTNAKKKFTFVTFSSFSDEFC